MQNRTNRKLTRYIGTESYYRIGNGDADSSLSFRRTRAAFWYLFLAAVFFAVGFAFTLF